MQNSPYSLPQEYPVLGKLKHCPNDINLLMELYSGAAGELSSTMQYVYQGIELNGCDQQLSDTLIGISIVEMRHLKMLGTALVSMGADPRFIMPAKRQFWQASAVNYTRDPCSMLLKDLKDELDAIDHYLSAARKMQNHELSVLLQRIALDEQLHAEHLQRLIRQIIRKG